MKSLDDLLDRRNFLVSVNRKILPANKDKSNQEAVDELEEPDK